MASWEPRTVKDIVLGITEGDFVLPVIQRRLEWTEEQMEDLFDTLLKGGSFGGIIAIKEETGAKPLFPCRPFTKDGSDIASSEMDTLDRSRFFVIDGQQRLQSFYIGLTGTRKGKNLFFDLFSNGSHKYGFKFSDSVKDLPLKATKAEEEHRSVVEYCWYRAQDLFVNLKNSNDAYQVAQQIITSRGISNEEQQKLVRANVYSFFLNVMNNNVLGLSLVEVNRTREAVDNRQQIVTLFRRLNNGGTKLSSFDLVASTLKGYGGKDMETFIDNMSKEFSDIGLDQDHLVKLLFLLQDNNAREMADIVESDATFAIQNKDRIRSCFTAMCKFLDYAGLYNYYKDGKQSFIPLYFILYHLFHQKQIADTVIEEYFDNSHTNTNLVAIKKWLMQSLINGVFHHRARWRPSTTGVGKLLGVLKDYKGKDFPCDAIFKMYVDYPLSFTTVIEDSTLDRIDRNLLYYMIYNKELKTRRLDIDHIIPKSRLEGRYEIDQINNIRNYELLDSGTNRGNKNAMEYRKWVTDCVKDKPAYMKKHLIPQDETLWDEDHYLEFLQERAKLIIAKLREYISS